MQYKISVVIRTYNEEKHLREVLESLKNQTYKNFEIIILDSESNDNTINIANEYNTIVKTIKKSEFNYSYASNKCVEYSTGDLVCFLSGHSVPVSESYLELTNEIFQNDKVGACYGDVIALNDGSFTEKIFHGVGHLKNIISIGKDNVKLEKDIHPGIFSCSNACARRNLLVKHPFSEDLGKGGEDIEVAYRIIKNGYYIALVPDLLVRHSHGNGLKKFIKEYKSWKIMWEDVINYINRELQ